jgi:hypothetical protein
LAALGGLRAMVVMPSLDLTVNWNDTKIRGAKKENEALKRLVGAMTGRPKEKDE